MVHRRGEGDSSPRQFFQSTNGRTMPHNPRKPYTLIGAGQLTGSVYKTGDVLTGFDYRFKIVRRDDQTGCASEWFRPDDIVALLNLARLLAAELTNDGCLEPELSRRLVKLAAALDHTLNEISSEPEFNGTSEQ